MRCLDILRAVPLWLTCTGIFLFMGGCGRSDGPERIAAFGTVTAQSGDLVDGMISFLPEAGTRGPAATTSLVGGAFAFDRRNGPVEGKYRVLVVKQLADRKHKGSSPGDSNPTSRPAQTAEAQAAAGEEWSFTAEVSPADMQFDFEIPPAPTSISGAGSSGQRVAP
jgi:hypothetical protein